MGADSSASSFAGAASSSAARTVRRCARVERDMTTARATGLPPRVVFAESFAGDALAEAFRRRPAKAWVQVAMAAIVQC